MAAWQFAIRFLFTIYLKSWAQGYLIMSQYCLASRAHSCCLWEYCAVFSSSMATRANPLLVVVSQTQRPWIISSDIFSHAGVLTKKLFPPYLLYSTGDFFPHPVDRDNFTIALGENYTSPKNFIINFNLVCYNYS